MERRRAHRKLPARHEARQRERAFVRDGAEHDRVGVIVLGSKRMVGAHRAEEVLQLVLVEVAIAVLIVQEEPPLELRAADSAELQLIARLRLYSAVVGGHLELQLAVVPVLPEHLPHQLRAPLLQENLLHLMEAEQSHVLRKVF